VYADDVADAFVRAANAAGTHADCIWNVGTGTQTTLREIVDTVRTLLGVAAEPP
jgi:nucleoside-diphosphate-sugar epimerase